MYVLKNDTSTNRLGISVSKKVGNSVVRHHYTRLIREGWRLSQDRMKVGYDIVVVVRIGARGKNYHDIRGALLHLAEKHHLIADDV